MWYKFLLLLLLSVIAVRVKEKRKTKLQRLKDQIEKGLEEKTEEISSLKQKFDDFEQKCFDSFSVQTESQTWSIIDSDKKSLKNNDKKSLNNLNQWVKTSNSELAGKVEELRGTLSSLKSDATVKTYDGCYLLHDAFLEDLSQRFENFTTQLNDLNSRLKYLEENFYTGPTDGYNETRDVTALKGDKGDYGLPGLSGENGETGDNLNCSKGIKGDMGSKGKKGARGPRGLKGEQGEKGMMILSLQDLHDNDIKFVEGLKGEDGQDGLPGLPGLEGQKGEPGPQGPEGKVRLTGFLLTRHSQSSQVPDCPAKMKQLWKGYSLLSGGGTGTFQDLGQAGSCISEFKPSGFQSCDSESCQYDDTSFWLPADLITGDSMVAPVRQVEPHISRCVVCESPTNVLAVHSQKSHIPDCPRGWSGLWSGYSYLKISSMSDHHQLSSSGSCLEKFLAVPVIKCSDGKCRYPANETSVWLSAESNLNTSSRCQVCVRN